MKLSNNIFEYATSELSQDAFLCWWLAWADKSYLQTNPALHLMGLDFLVLLAKKSNIQLGTENTVELKTQYKNIDILCVVNKKLVFLIEDKTDSSEHSDQLLRYKETLFGDKDYKLLQIVPIYVKTGNQSNYSRVSEHNYSIIKRNDLLNLLKKHTNALACSDIASDFYEHLDKLENDFQSYQNSPTAEWSRQGQQGFLEKIRSEINTGQWNYAPNPNGGEYVLYFSFQELYIKNNDAAKIYLQVTCSGSQRNRKIALTFRIGGIQDKSIQTSVRDFFTKQVLETEIDKQGSIKLVKPKSPGKGKSMNIALVEHFPVIEPSKNTVNISETVALIKKAQTLLAAFPKTYI